MRDRPPFAPQPCCDQLPAENLPSIGSVRFAMDDSGDELVFTAALGSETDVPAVGPARLSAGARLAAAVRRVLSAEHVKR